jgi:uncharacterized protein
VAHRQSDRPVHISKIADLTSKPCFSKIGPCTLENWTGTLAPSYRAPLYRKSMEEKSLPVAARPLPALTPDNRDFWTGGAVGRLMIARCLACGRYSHPPFPACPYCRHRECPPVAVSGNGQVNTWTVNHHAWLPDMAVPFIFAAVELAEQAGLLVMTNIVNCDTAEIHVGMPVRVLFEQHDDVWIPLFEPAR